MALVLKMRVREAYLVILSTLRISSIVFTLYLSNQSLQSSNMGKSHKYNDRDHAGLADGTALPQRAFAPRTVLERVDGGVDGEEVQDEGFNMANARRRSNSSSYTAGLKDFKTKFEQIETEPVFEEDIHGALMEELPETTRSNTNSSEGSSVDEDVKANSPTENVLVTGGTRGLGEAICLKFAAEGCNVAINYVSIWGGVVCLRADVSLESDCISVVKETIKGLGGLDVIISNAGYTRVLNFLGYLCSYSRRLAKMLCYKCANEEGGVFIITSSIAGVITGGSSMPYSVTKAAQLHLMKCLAATQGPKVRINAVLPGLLLTEWAYLKQVTDIGDCAQVFVDISKNSSMTGQKIQVDSGLAQNV
ncbi:hypothetical protein DID88_006863 [Monilinia fructigena]|uniref:Ketoreductase (KR) domain-containing protein n=1 Tax=Monilinia fructigena TaxID=38457 RepID=A0A395IJ51_9HELO|nr:hypothetical protein DID88_006863 [Monilinia fructigena]